MFLIGIEARRIQRYVLASPRLRDMVGASEIVNRACNELPKKILHRLGAKAESLRYGAAGRTWILLNNERQAKTFVRIWPVIIDAYAPGLEMPAALAEFEGTPKSEEQAIDAVRALLQARQAWPSMPTAELSPLVERSPRTGGEAVYHGAKGELVDSVTFRQEEVGASLTTFGTIRPPRGKVFPREIDRLVGERGGLAVVHADGNDIGAKVSTVRERADRAGTGGIDALAEFSKQLREANESAVQRALEEAVYQPLVASASAAEDRDLPVRPLVIGGDDVTLLIRSDLALPFVTAYLRRFEEETERCLGQKLTACAGVVVVRPNHPFLRAYRLAESLCDWAKKCRRREQLENCRPSLVAFHRLTADAGDNYEAVLESELTSRGDGDTTDDRLQLTSGPYAPSSLGGFLGLDGLEKLADALKDLPRGPRRLLLTDLSLGGRDANLAWSRTQELSPEKAKTVGDALEALHKTRKPVAAGKTPLLDAHNLLLFRSRRA